MPDFKKRLALAIDKSTTYRSRLSTLSRDIGKNRNYIANLLNGSSSVDPSLTTCRRLSERLGVSIEYLAGMVDEMTVTGDGIAKGTVNLIAEKLIEDIHRATKEAVSGPSRRPDMDDLIRWWHMNDGVVPDHTGMLEYVDFHEKPQAEDHMLKPHSLGPNSLASKVLGTPDVDLLRRSMESLTPENMETALSGYRHIEGANFHVTIENVSAKHAATAAPIKLTYRRLLMPVRDKKGHELILNYSKLID